VLAGSRAHIERARRFRKMLGGGMRQAGILAAAAEYALDHNVARLPEDHANARLIATRLGLDPAAVPTNIVMIDLRPHHPPAVELQATLQAAGVRCLAIAPRRLRLVAHLDVTRAECEEAAEILARTLGPLAQA
jgi:threonine aldolase